MLLGEEGRKTPREENAEGGRRKEAGLKRSSIHSLRHPCVTVLFSGLPEGGVVVDLQTTDSRCCAMRRTRHSRGTSERSTARAKGRARTQEEERKKREFVQEISWEISRSRAASEERHWSRERSTSKRTHQSASVPCKTQAAGLLGESYVLFIAWRTKQTRRHDHFHP